MKLFNYIIPTAAVAILPACSSEADINEEPSLDNGNYLHISVSVNENVSNVFKVKENDTRAIENLESTTFESGDKVGVIVYEDGVFVGNYPYVYDGENWNPEGKRYVCTTPDITNRYIVYSPYNAGVTAATASVEGLKSLIGPDKSLVAGKYDQSSKEKYHACDLMTQTIEQDASNLTLSATIEHEYAVLLIDYSQSTFETRNGHTLNWTSALVGDSDGDGEYTSDDGFVTVEYGDQSMTYIPWLNHKGIGGDDHYRMIVPVSEARDDRVTFSWVQEDFEKYKSFHPEIFTERGKLYKCHDQGYLKESEREIEVGDIYCRDETDDSGVVFPLAMFRSSKYRNGTQCTYLVPIGVVFSTQTSQYDKNDGYTHGYVIALKNAGQYKFGYTTDRYEDIPDIANPLVKDPSITDEQARTMKMTAEPRNAVKSWTINDCLGRKNCTAALSFASNNYTTLKNNYPGFYYALKYSENNSDYKAPKNTSTPCSDWYLPSAPEMKFYYQNMAQLKDSDLYYIFNADGGDYNVVEAVYWKSATTRRIADMMNNFQSYIDAYMGTSTGQDNSWCQKFTPDDDFLTSSEVGPRPNGMVDNLMVGFMNRLEKLEGFGGEARIAFCGRGLASKDWPWTVRPVLAF